MSSFWWHRADNTDSSTIELLSISLHIRKTECSRKCSCTLATRGWVVSEELGCSNDLRTWNPNEVYTIFKYVWQCAHTRCARCSYERVPKTHIVLPGITLLVYSCCYSLRMRFWLFILGHRLKFVSFGSGSRVLPKL